MNCHLLIDNTLKVAKALVSVMEARTLISTALLQKTMNDVFKGSDSQGAWIWKDAYDAVEVALVLYLKQRGQQLIAKGISSQEVLAELMVLEALCPTHTKRSQETLELQQFSTPISLAYIANVAGAIRRGDIVLEPSAGTGLLVASAEAYGGELILNEISPKRVGILRQVFAGAWITTVNGEQIDDYLTRDLTPTLVIMNPPFSASPKVSKRTPHATVKHIGSALARLQQGGRLVAIAANWFSPDNPRWRDTFVDWQKKAELVFSVGIAGKLYAKHGTSIDTRLFVFDKLPAPDPTVFHANPAIIGSSQELLELVQAQVPHRQAVNTEKRKGNSSHGDRQLTALSTVEEYHTALSTLPLFQYQAEAIAKRCLQSRVAVSTQKEQKAKSSPEDFGSIVQIEYIVKDWQNTHKEIASGLYETYETQSIAIAGAVEHPSPLVESVAMGSVAPPKPTYRPHLPERLLREGILSAPQIESIIYAGQAHQNHLNAYYLVDDSLEFATTVEKEELGAIRLRRGWFLGDGTGCGKGRQVAGIILDNYLQGRRQAIWVSKSDKLIEDARRDWTALGGDKTLIMPLSRFRQGESIELEEGIVFVTYATLRTEERQEKKSRVQQLIDWCKKDFQGIIAFDECHAMGNATSEKGERGIKKPSQQGIAGLRLQYGLPNARVVYVSATGATTIKNIAYATRLGLWQTKDFPFNSQSEFAASMEKGGIAAMEAISRDLKALGLYLSRALSYQGVQYEILEHELSEEQIRIYDSYADAFGIIHHNIEAALQAANITDHKGKSRNANATSAVYSAFESNKQRFFNHLLTSMKCPTVLHSIEQALVDGHAVIVQLVSTNEALLERRLANIPASDWSDINLDITPREYVMDYLFHSFPVYLHEFYTDEKGNERSRAVVDAGGKPVTCQQALRLRDDMVEQLALLPSVPGALDQLIQHFGHEQVAEITGRSKRVLLEKEANRERLYVQNRPGSANLSEAEAFMNDTKRILVFSEAGGTGRSYHADLNSTNQRLRIHYLLEAGWRADNAIQGLGRSNRTNQKQPPLYRPVTTNVKGEKRFTSTIARRLDSLGALTRGQRQTGGQGLFREEDNLESSYAKAALLQLYSALCNGSISCCTLVQFQKATGLSLLTEQGYIKEELPPISQFLNRVLALKIELQNALFEEFELRLASIVEGAMAAGTYAIGVETLNAGNFHVLERREVFQHPQTGAKTTCCEIEKHTRTKVLLLDSALALAETKAGRMVRNERSKRVALAVPTNSIVLDDGSIQKRVNIIGTIGNKKMPVEQLEQSHWVEIALYEFQQLWAEELSYAPQFTCETFYLVTGLLLPIWNCLPPDNMRVYRLQLNSGERMLGRVIQSEHLASVYTKLGIVGGPTLSASEIFHAVFNRKQVMQLGHKWQLRSSLIMGSKRLEVIGELQKAEVELLKSMGCITEVINWKLRVFIPINDNAVSTIEQIQSLK